MKNCRFNSHILDNSCFECQHTLVWKTEWYSDPVRHWKLKPDGLLKACVLLDFPILVSSFNVQFRAIDKHLHMRASLLNKTTCVTWNSRFQTKFMLYQVFTSSWHGNKIMTAQHLQCFHHISCQRSLHLLPQIIHLQ